MTRPDRTRPIRRWLSAGLAAVVGVTGGIAASTGGASAAGSDWLPVVTLASGGQRYTSPQVAADPTGAVTATWAADGVAQSSYYDPRAGSWGAPVVIGDAGTSPSALAVSVTGAALQVLMAGRPLLATRFDPANRQWTAPVQISEGTSSGMHVSAVVDEQNRATVVWYELAGEDDTRVLARRFDPSLGWSDIEVLSANSAVEYYPTVTVDRAGVATAAWSFKETRDGDSTIQSRRFDPASGAWGDTVALATAPDTGDVSMATDAAGTVTGAWSQSTSTGENLVVRRYDPASGAWGAPQTLASEVMVFSVRAAANSAGAVAVGWGSVDNDGGYMFRARTLPAGSSTWHATATLATERTASGAVAVGIDGTGIATMMWSSGKSDTTAVSASRSNPATGQWSTPTALTPSGDYSDAVLGVSAGGTVATAWVTGSVTGAGSVQSRRFGSPPGVPPAPTEVKGRAGDQQVDVSWTPVIADPPVTQYDVTARPGGATCTATPDMPACTVTGLANRTAYTFTVTATNALGTSPASAASEPVTPSANPGPDPDGRQRQRPTKPLGLPDRLAPTGRTVLLDHAVRTNAGKTATVRARCLVRTRAAVPRGDATACRIVRRGSTVAVVLTGTAPVRVRLVLRAAGTPQYRPYRSVHAWTSR